MEVSKYATLQDSRKPSQPNPLPIPCRNSEPDTSKDAYTQVKKKIKKMYHSLPQTTSSSTFSLSAPLKRYMTVTTALPPALTKTATADPAVL